MGKPLAFLSSSSLVKGTELSSVFQHSSTKDKQQQLFQHEGEELPFPCPKTSMKGAPCSSWPPLHPRKGSGVAEGHLPPQPPTQAVLDPALLPLLHCCHLVGRLQHGDTATPGGTWRVQPAQGAVQSQHCCMDHTGVWVSVGETSSCHLQVTLMSTKTS